MVFLIELAIGIFAFFFVLGLVIAVIRVVLPLAVGLLIIAGVVALGAALFSSVGPALMDALKGHKFLLSGTGEEIWGPIALIATVVLIVLWWLANRFRPVIDAFIEALTERLKQHGRSDHH